MGELSTCYLSNLDLYIRSYCSRCFTQFSVLCRSLHGNGIFMSASVELQPQHSALLTHLHLNVEEKTMYLLSHIWAV